jgi:hypothetical protein
LLASPEARPGEPPFSMIVAYELLMRQGQAPRGY